MRGRAKTSWATLTHELARLVGEMVPPWVRADTLAAAKRASALLTRDLLRVVDEAPSKIAAAETLGIARSALYRIVDAVRPG